MALDSLRRLARGGLDLVDRLLRPARRRAALARLRDSPHSILFVCNGNICRSPFAAVVATQQLADAGHAGIRIESAGIIGPDRPCPAVATAAALDFGVDLSAHRSRLLSPAMVRAAALIIVMDTRQRAHICTTYGRHPRDVQLLGDLDPQPDDRRTIVDPVDRPRPVFDACYARIHRSVMVLTGARPSSLAQAGRADSKPR